MEQSILKSTKKLLSQSPDSKSFELDVLTSINTAFARLQSLGFARFAIQDETPTWDDYFSQPEHDGIECLEMIKTYIYLRVRLVFDPPDTPHHIAAMKEQREELEYSLKTERELAKWTAPSSLRSPL